MFSKATQPAKLTYSEMSSWLAKEGYNLQVRTIRDLGKDLANHFIGVTSGGRGGKGLVYDPSSWPKWKVILQMKLKRKMVREINEELIRLFGAPTVKEDDEHSVGLMTIQEEVADRVNKLMEPMKEAFQEMKDALQETRATHAKESEIRHADLMEAIGDKKRLEVEITNLKQTQEKRRELIAKAARLKGILTMTERLKILDELTALEITNHEK